jgi:methylmalonyl-CoA mutase cobalamin-binding subunit
MVSAREILEVARGEWFDVFGISVGSETHLDTLASVILEGRKASRNRSLLVVVGGPIVASTPGLVSRVGADATAEDAPEAIREVERLLAVRSVAS